MGVLVLYGHNPEDIRTWDDIVDRSPVPDVYYRPAYLRAYALTGHGRPLGVVIRSGSAKVLFPLLVRRLDVGGATVQDAVTPYGYGGLLQISGPTNPDPPTVQDIVGQLREWARASGLAACTIRLHPILQQESRWGLSHLPEGWARIFARGQTASVDLTHWDDSDQRISSMRQNRRQDLKKARASLGVTIAEGPDACKALPSFRELYRETMERLDADRFFLFADEYYDLLANELADKFALITASSDAGPVASAIFLADSLFAHYHLAASNDEGRRFGAATLLVNAAGEWARQRGCSRLHLGGGLRADDKLWEFKRSFGGERSSYSYVTLIADSHEYDSLTKGRTVWPYDSSSTTSSDEPSGGSSVIETPNNAGQPDRSSSESARRSRQNPQRRIAIYGAAGFGREVAPLAKEMVAKIAYGCSLHEPVVFVSDVEGHIGKMINGLRVISYEDLLTTEHRDRQVVVALSDGSTRRSIVEQCERDGFEFSSVISASHRSYDDVNVAVGGIICDYTVFVANIHIGRHFHCNMFSYVGHDCDIGDFVTFAPGVSCSGRIRIEDDVFVGVGALLRPGTEEKRLVIGKGAVIGMGAIVTSDIPAGARIVGMGAVATRLSAAGRDVGGKLGQRTEG